MDIQTTSIDSLPLSSSEKEPPVQNVNNAESNNAIVEPTHNFNENEFITDLQKAAKSGMTTLPSRDVPQDTSNIQQDMHVKANFIPPTQGDYITQHQTTEDIMKQNSIKDLEKNKFDFLYNELAIPSLIVLVYFMYQLPAVRKIFLTTFPFCYNLTGDINFTGRIVNALFFGFTIYAITKILYNISQ